MHLWTGTWLAVTDGRGGLVSSWNSAADNDDDVTH